MQSLVLNLRSSVRACTAIAQHPQVAVAKTANGYPYICVVSTCRKILQVSWNAHRCRLRTLCCVEWRVGTGGVVQQQWACSASLPKRQQGAKKHVLGSCLRARQYKYAGTTSRQVHTLNANGKVRRKKRIHLRLQWTKSNRRLRLRRSSEWR